MKESRFVYKKRTAAQFEAAKSRRGSGFDSYIKRDVKKYKIREGKNRVRFLPPTWEDADHFAYEIWINYDIGPDKGRYLSLSRMGKGRDPIAEARLKASGDLAKKLAPSRKWVAWVIDRFDEASEAEGPQLMDYPGKLNTAIMTKSQDIDTRDIVFVDDPDEGADVRFFTEGKGIGTTYPGEKVDILKSSPLSEDPAQQERWLQYVKNHPVPDCLNFFDYDYISAVYNGTASSNDEDEDEGEVHHEEKATASGQRETPPWEDKDEDEVPQPKAKPTAKPAEDDGDAIRSRFRSRVRATETAED